MQEAKNRYSLPLPRGHAAPPVAFNPFATGHRRLHTPGHSSAHGDGGPDRGPGFTHVIEYVGHVEDI